MIPIAFRPARAKTWQGMRGNLSRQSLIYDFWFMIHSWWSMMYSMIYFIFLIYDLWFMIHDYDYDDFLWFDYDLWWWVSSNSNSLLGNKIWSIVLAKLGWTSNQICSSVRRIWSFIKDCCFVAWSFGLASKTSRTVGSYSERNFRSDIMI